MQPAPPPPPGGPYPWPQPPPVLPRKEALPILVVVLVLVLVIGLLFAVFFFYLFLPLSRTPIYIVPSVTLGPVGFVARNATFEVTSVSTPAPVGFFDVNLRVGSETGTLRRIQLDPGYATILVSSQQYRVYFVDVGSNLTLGAGDRFTVTGNGTALQASTSFTFYLLWIVDGRVVGSTNWTTPSKTVVMFSSVNQSSGNATITVAAVSEAIVPSFYKVNLQVGTTVGYAVAMPTIGGSFVTLTIGARQYEINWTDIGGERTLNAGDNFRITGSNVALPPAMFFTFYLLWADGSSIQSSSWSTP